MVFHDQLTRFDLAPSLANVNFTMPSIEKKWQPKFENAEYTRL